MKENKTKQKKYLFELAFIASSKVCPQTSLTYPGDVFHLSSPARASDCIVDEVTLIMSTAWLWNLRSYQSQACLSIATSTL